MSFIVLYILIIGLCVGSFLNVCIYRIPRGESISFPASHCTNCNNRLKILDLIPVLSFVFLGGKCRYCGKKISIRYPLLELITGVLIIALYLKYGLSFEFIKYVILITFLIVIGKIDFDTTDVYFKTTLSGIIAGVVFVIFEYFNGFPVLTYIWGGLLGGGLISLIIILTKGMGWGDAEICLLGGLFLGFKLTIVMLFFSFVFGGAIGGLLIIMKKKSRKDYIPFGPYIALAAIFTVFFGKSILNWYL